MGKNAAIRSCLRLLLGSLFADFPVEANDDLNRSFTVESGKAPYVGKSVLCQNWLRTSFI